MKVGGKPYRSIWHAPEDHTVRVIDQRWLPHEFRTADLRATEEFETAIRDMWIRGAPLIGATAAYGVAFEMARDASDASLDQIWERLNATRPTAINLRWALNRCRTRLADLPHDERAAAALELAHEIAEEDVEVNRRIGEHGLEVIRKLASEKTDGEPVRILTHCNAGWLAAVDWGTATSPVYQAHDEGLDVFIWVDETRPRNQGAITAWELGNHGVPHKYVADNAGGHLMQHDQVDMAIVGTDRVTACGDVCNKIGTYLKALAAADNGIPFYVALPSSTIDWTVNDGLAEIPIEERAGAEVSHVSGKDAEGKTVSVQVSPDGSELSNPAFDVTPARLITGGLITERGICPASSKYLAAMFPEASQMEA